MQILNSHQLRMSTSRDPTETVRHLSHYLFEDIKFSPVGRRSYLARVGGFKFGGFSVALIETSIPVIVEGRSSASHYVMTSCLHGSANFCVDGKTVRMGEGASFVSRPARLSATFSSDCVRLVVRLSADVLGGLTPADGVEFSLSSPGMAAWLGQVQGLLSCPSLMDAVERDARARGQMEQLLSTLLRSGQASLPAMKQGTLIASGDVRRAEAFMRLRLRDNISLTDIVAAAGVGKRTLQKNFIQFRAVTPMQYLLRIRLEAVREQLLSGNEDSSVTNAAFEAGFRHPSRFASLYRAQYGELPSATLRLGAPRAPPGSCFRKTSGDLIRPSSQDSCA